jgi:hypothetical protein
MKMAIPEVCAMNINVMVLTTLGKVNINAGTNIAPVVLFIPVISKTRHADKDKNTISNKPCTDGTLSTPPRP